jgi:hypothetical protein
MLFIILLIVITFYVIEVVLGSSATVYNCEIGYESYCEEPKKLSPKQFFCELIPIFAGALGVPLLMTFLL